MAVLCMAFRYLANAHYGIAVAALTGTVVILLSFEGVKSGIAVTDRVINTALGCGMAMLAYVLWPTWERSRARAALADMLDAYANYLRALAQPDQRNAQRETRTTARIARTNAQASLDRMRVEPATPPALLELARALFANGNRLARTAMTLEALDDDMRSNASLLPPAEQAHVSRFVSDTADAVQSIAAALREQRPIPPLPDLQAQWRELADLLRLTEDKAIATRLIHISDRLVDNVQTLAHVVGRGQQLASTATAEAQVQS